MAEHPSAPAPRGNAVFVAALISGLSGYVVLVMTARGLSPAQNVDFLVFWGAMFACFGVLVGIASEGTRAVFAAGHHRVKDPSSQAAVLPIALALGAGCAAVIGVTGLWWAPYLFPLSTWPLLTALVAGVLLFSTHCGLGGALAGSAHWSGYASLVSFEALLRVMLVLLVLLTGGHLVGYAFSSALAAGAWLVLSLTSTSTRHAWTARADVGTRELLANIARVCVAAAASGLLLVGFPVLLRVTSSDSEAATAAPLIMAISLTRAPLLVPLGAYQTVLTTRVIALGLRALRIPVLLVAASTAVGIPLSYWLGPRLLVLIRPEYHLDAHVFALLVVAAGLVALVTLTGAAALAKSRHGGYLIGWLTAVLVAFVALLIPAGLETRTLVALLAGPVAGIAVHLVIFRSGFAAVPHPL